MNARNSTSPGMPMLISSCRSEFSMMIESNSRPVCPEVPGPVPNQVL